MGRTSVAIAALATCLLVTGSLATGCATAEASPAVRPVNVVLVNSGGADPPSGEYTDLVVSCGEDLRAGRDAECEQAAVAASASPDPQVAALGESMQYIAQVNQGKYDLSQQTLQRLKQRLRTVHPTSRKPMTELVFRAEAVAYAASGDQNAADEATRTAQEAAPDARAAEITAERCRAAPNAPSCAGTPSSSGSPSPTSSARTSSPQSTTAPHSATPAKSSGNDDDQQTPQPSN